MADHFPLMIPGAKSSGKLLVTAPFDGAEIATASCVDSKGVENALENGHRLSENRDLWLSMPKRLEILDKAATLMEQKADMLAIEAAREGGKPLIDSRVEVARAIDGGRICIETLRTQSGTEIPMGLNAASLNRLAFTNLEPIGLVVAISAFNHPLNLIVHQVGPAIAAGCPVIVKPSMETPLSCLRFLKILRDAGLPENIAWLLNYLFDTVLDGRNEYLADGVQRALNRPPRDFADFARETAASGIWESKR